MKLAYKTVGDEYSGVELMMEQKHSPIVEKMAGLCTPGTPEEVDKLIDSIEYGDFYAYDLMKKNNE